MKKKVYRNWTMVLVFIVIAALYTIPSGTWGASVVMLLLFLPLVALALHWVHAPQGLFVKTEYADGVATVTHILRKKVQTVDLDSAAYLYKVKTGMPYLVVSDAPLATKKEAVAAYKAGKAGFVIMNAGGDALYPYEKKAQVLK